MNTAIRNYSVSIISCTLLVLAMSKSSAQVVHKIPNPDNNGIVNFPIFSYPIVYNNKLYVYYSNLFSSDYHLAEYNGTNFKVIPNPISGNNAVMGAPFIFASQLYFMLGGANGYQLAHYDGSSLATIPNTSGAMLSPGSPLVSFNQNLYTYGTRNDSGKLMVFDGLFLRIDTTVDKTGLFSAGSLLANSGSQLLLSDSGKLASTDGFSTTIYKKPDGFYQLTGVGAYKPVVANGTVYFAYNDTINNFYHLGVFAGGNPVALPNFGPDDAGYQGTAFALNNQLYFQYQAAQAPHPQLAKFDGSGITLIPSPDAGQFYFRGYKDFAVSFQNAFYMLYQTASGTIQLARYDGSKLTLLANPDGGTGFNGSLFVYGGKIYSSYVGADRKGKLISFDGTRFQFITPADGSNVSFTNPIVYNNTLYFSTGGNLAYLEDGALSATLVDPNPSMLLPNGQLSTDIASVDYSNVVSGAATDGVTNILVVVKSPVPVTFTLGGSNDGFFKSLTNPGLADSTTITVTPRDGVAIGVYRVPDGCGQNNAPGGRTIVINVSGTTGLLSLPLNLITPPVVLIHGLWSNPGIWDGLANYLYSRGFPSWNFSRANYCGFTKYTFDPLSKQSIYGQSALLEAVSTALNSLRQRHFAGSQVDIVAHSLGGLISRCFSQLHIYTDNSNINSGPIHKLITLGTPHRGSPLGPELYKVRNNPIYLGTGIPVTVGSALARNGMPIGDVLQDFGITSSGVLALNKTLPLKSYAICGNDIGNGPGLGVNQGYLAMNALTLLVLGKTLSGVFSSYCETSAPIDNDLIVPLYSQTGYIDSDTVFLATGHSSPAANTETNSPFIQEKVRRLLLSNQNSEFSVGFPKPSDEVRGCNTTSERIIEPDAQTTIRKVQVFPFKIESPVSAAIYNAGSNQVIHLKVSVPADIKSVVFFSSEQEFYPVYDSLGFSADISVPAKFAGKLSLTALAKDSSGTMMVDTTSVQIVPAGVLDSLAVEPRIIVLDSFMREKQVFLNGFYHSADSTTDINLSSADAGTTYLNGNAGVFRVTPDGLVIALKPGIDQLTIKQGTKIIQVPVQVDGNFLQASLSTNSIIFSPITDKSAVDVPFGLDATALSGDQVDFTIVSGPATIQNGVLIINGAGSVTVRATSGSNVYFLAAAPVQQTFNVTAAALPVKFVNVAALLVDQDVELRWTTSTEINTNNYIAQRSVNGVDFTDIATVKSVGSLTENKYVYSDINPQWPVTGLLYYRLQEVDKDGSITRSNTVSVRKNSNLFRINIYPNPSNEIINIDMPVAVSKNAVITLFDANGRKVMQYYTQSGQHHELPVKQFPSGKYDIIINAGDQRIFSRHVIIMH